jgi:hypothetical protein
MVVHDEVSGRPLPPRGGNLRRVCFRRRTPCALFVVPDVDLSQASGDQVVSALVPYPFPPIEQVACRLIRHRRTPSRQTRAGTHYAGIPGDGAAHRRRGVRGVRPAVSSSPPSAILTPLWFVFPAVSIVVIRRTAVRCDGQPVVLLSLALFRTPPAPFALVTHRRAGRETSPQSPEHRMVADAHLTPASAYFSSSGAATVGRLPQIVPTLDVTQYDNPKHFLVNFSLPVFSGHRAYWRKVS